MPNQLRYNIMAGPHQAWLMFCITLCALHGAVDASDTWAPEGLVASFPISTEGQLLLMPVTVADTRRMFLLDTGLTTIMFDSSLVKNLKRSQDDGNLRTQGENLSVPRYHAPKMAIQDASIDWIDEVNSASLKPLVRVLGSEFDGVIGMSTLRRFVLHFDFDNGVALVCDPRHVSSPPGSSVPLELNGNLMPCIMVQLPGGLRKVFQLDTGFNKTVSIERDLFESLQQSHAIAPTGAWIRFTHADNSSTAVEVGRCAEIAVGQHSHKGLVVTPGKTNMLGLSFLCRYRATFDFVNKRLYLDPSKRFGVRDRQDGDGIVLDGKSIKYIAKGSVGDHLGLRVADELLTINGKSSAHLSEVFINRILTFPRVDDMPLTIRRGDRTIEVTLPGG